MAYTDARVSHRSTLAVIVGSAIVGAALVAFSTSPVAVETWFAEGVGTTATRIMSALSGTLPFSIAEWVEGAVVAWLVLAPIPALREVRRGERSLQDALLSGALQLLALLGIALVLFYGLWGLNYGRPSANERLGWPAVDLADPDSDAELEQIADVLVARVNQLYRALHGSDDIGVMSEPVTPLPLDHILDAGWERVTTELGLHPTVALSRGPAKPLLSSPIWSYLGIAGFYFPFTGEANYNRDQPAWQLSHTIAHEKAHQRGIASEDEANFFGFLVCIRSEDPFVRYGGWLFAQRKILGTLARSNPDLSEPIVARRIPGVQRDIDEMRAFWAAYRGPASTVGQAVNDAYLRANRVEGGIQSYSLSARLIVAWIREDPGVLTPPHNL